MKRVIQKKVEHEVLSLIPNISYTCVPSWYGSTMRNLKMDIIAPKVREGHEKCPLILWICGGAFRVVDRSVWIPEMMYFARKGYIVASIEYRTSNESVFPASLVDGKAAVRFLKAYADEFCIDTDRICVMGESAGGALASLIGFTEEEKEYDRGDFLDQDSSVNAVVAFYGVADMMNDFAEGKAEEGRYNDDVPPWTFRDYLGINATEETARKSSAITYINEKTPPVMILHGSEDTVVPMEQSTGFYEKLQEQGIYSEFYVVEGAAHGDEAFYQTEVLDIVDQFLKKVL